MIPFIEVLDCLKIIPSNGKLILNDYIFDENYKYDVTLINKDMSYTYFFNKNDAHTVYKNQIKYITLERNNNLLTIENNNSIDYTFKIIINKISLKK